MLRCHPSGPVAGHLSWVALPTTPILCSNEVVKVFMNDFLDQAPSSGGTLVICIKAETFHQNRGLMNPPLSPILHNTGISSVFSSLPTWDHDAVSLKDVGADELGGTYGCLRNNPPWVPLASPTPWLTFRKGRAPVGIPNTSPFTYTLSFQFPLSVFSAILHS